MKPRFENLKTIAIKKIVKYAINSKFQNLLFMAGFPSLLQFNLTKIQIL